MKTIILLGVIIYATHFALADTHKTAVPFEQTKAVAASFKFIRGHKQGKNITVNWGMHNNSGVNNFIVESTYEDPNDPYSVWGTVGVIPCTNSPIFKFTNYPELPGTLNYRVTAVMDDNSTVTSGIYSVEIPQ